ncbi:type IV secretory system conjugative DNA transfer family protein [Cysteiniphilum sp. JM-1]|uniref:type IV secretory system conjugative DNA transfer family protein n=1 Tax=Cysteiniphilum sp. JM-1 TaxID=2610891 RepID=UPI001244E251|nr:type IV secretory system conjugative DNA transfer family protein [Cysteiniphilum sp. JM-1]
MIYDSPDLYLDTVYDNKIVQKTDEKFNIRSKALKNAAYEYGTQAGLYWASETINRTLRLISNTLDQVYNFAPLILESNILPPVIISSKNKMQVQDYKVTFSGSFYKIVRPAKFYSNMPTWHDYLILNYPEPLKPDISIMPKNTQEQSLWNRYLSDATVIGVNQAKQIYTQKLSELERDYVGMIYYKRLFSNGMVDYPVISSTQLAVSAKDNAMSIDNRALMIDKQPQLNANLQDWKPEVEALR